MLLDLKELFKNLLDVPSPWQRIIDFKPTINFIPKNRKLRIIVLNLCQRERNKRGQWQSFYETTQLHSWLAPVAIINLLNSTWQIFPILDFRFAKIYIIEKHFRKGDWMKATG